MSSFVFYFVTHHSSEATLEVEAFPLSIVAISVYVPFFFIVIIATSIGLFPVKNTSTHIEMQKQKAKKMYYYRIDEREDRQEFSITY